MSCRPRPSRCRSTLPNPTRPLPRPNACARPPTSTPWSRGPRLGRWGRRDLQELAFRVGCPAPDGVDHGTHSTPPRMGPGSAGRGLWSPRPRTNSPTGSAASGTPQWSVWGEGSPARSRTGRPAAGPRHPRPSSRRALPPLRSRASARARRPTARRYAPCPGGLGHPARPGPGARRRAAPGRDRVRAGGSVPVGRSGARGDALIPLTTPSRCGLVRGPPSNTPARGACRPCSSTAGARHSRPLAGGAPGRIPGPPRA